MAEHCLFIQIGRNIAILLYYVIYFGDGITLIQTWACLELHRYRNTTEWLKTYNVRGRSQEQHILVIKVTVATKRRYMPLTDFNKVDYDLADT